MKQQLSFPQIRSLENELAAMKERIAEIELTLSIAREPFVRGLPEWGLSRAEGDIVEILAKHSPCKPRLLAERALFDRIDMINNPSRLIWVQICKIRKKIAVTRGVISHDLESGYALDETSRRLITGRRINVSEINL